MSADCFCDYDPAEVYERCDRKARKQHLCDECRRKINPGEKYENVFGVWEGRADTFKTCSHCLDLRRWTEAHVPCVCWSHGNLIEDCADTIDRYAHECPGLKFGFLRKRVAIIRARSNSNG